MPRLKIMTTRHSAFYSPLICTIAAGFLEAEGIEASYERLPVGETVMQHLRSGAVHVAQSAVSASFQTLDNGSLPGFVHFAQINARDGFFITARAADPVFSWHALKGKRVLVDHGRQPLAMFRYACLRQGVDFDDIRAVDAGEVEEIVAAYLQGDADYVHLQGPWPQQLVHDGLGHVVARVGDAIGPVAFSSLCAVAEWLARDEARAFMRAYRKARAWVRRAPAAEVAAAEAAYFPDTAADVLADTIAAYQNLGNWDGDDAIGEEDFNAAVDVFMQAGLLSTRLRFDQACCKPPC